MTFKWATLSWYNQNVNFIPFFCFIVININFFSIFVYVMSTQICLTKSNNLVSCFKFEIWNFSSSRQSFCFSLEFTYFYYETTTKSLLVNFFEQHFNFLNHCIQTAKSSMKQTKVLNLVYNRTKKGTLTFYSKRLFLECASTNIFSV